MSKGISERRHHKERLKKKRKHDMVYYTGCPINKHVITPKLCSCWMCGSPRKFSGNSKHGKTIQELREDERNS